MTPPRDGMQLPQPGNGQSFENALLLREHSVQLDEIKRRLGNIERALWSIVAAFGFGFIAAIVTWIASGGLSR